jgi:CHAT domain-containing protein/Tfp pilus assembly protein PilF
MSCHGAGSVRGVLAAALVVTAIAPRAIAQDVRAIEPAAGFTLERELPAGASDRFALALTAGQFVDLVVTGADAAVASLVDPSGTERVRITRETSPDGAKRICAVAEQTGTYGVVVAGPKTAGARYRMRVNAVRPAGEEDRARAEAVRAFAEGERQTLLRSGPGYRGAIPEYRRAAERWHAAREAAEEGTAWFRLGFAYSSTSQYRDAIDAYQRSAALRHDLGDARAEGTALNNVGADYYELADYPNAQRYYERALDLRRATGDRNGEAFTVSGLGTVSQATGDIEQALTHYLNATALWKAAGNLTGEATGLNNTGAAYRALGRFQDALDSYTRALEIRRAANDRPGIANTLTQIGNLRVTLGDPDKALEAFREALPLRRAGGGRRGEGYTLSAMGTAFADRGDWSEAFAHLSQAGDIFREIEDRDGEAQALLSTGRTWLKRGDAQRALDPLGQARAIYETLGARRSIAYADVALAEAYARLGRSDDGIERYRSAASVFDTAADRNARLTALVGLAALEQRLGRLPDARGHAEAAVTLLEALRSDVAAEELRTSYLAARHDAYALYIDLEMQMHAREPGRGHVEAALVASERARARGLLDLLAEGHVRLRAALAPAGLSAAGLRRLLDRDTLLLEYALGAERSYLWAVTADSVQGFVLPPRARIEQAARRSYDLLARGAHRETQTQTRRALESLARLVLAPVPAGLSRPRVVVVADGALQYVPFAALPLPGGRVNAGQPMIAHHEIVTLPSASTLDALRRTPRSPVDSSRKLAVFADPVLRPGDPRVAAGARPAAAASGTPPESLAFRSARESGFTTLQRLPFARAEADAIVALAPRGETFRALDFDASRETALAELGRYRLVHFATHALLNSEHPEHSGILLSMIDRQGAPIDGFLRLQDVYNLQLHADLVVLSGCRTALGKDVRGEGLVGLTRGFLHAGAPAVVASLWDVRDRSTAELMTRMYRAMFRDRLVPAAALRAAQASMSKDPRWSAPSHWAGFTIQGDWNPLPPRNGTR